MKAAYYDEFGSARDVLRIGDLPTPVAGPDEVLIQVQVSGVNPSDVKSRRGAHPRALPRVTPHSDGAGVIVAVGGKVDCARIGERVWTWNAQWGRPYGTAAEFVALPAAQAVRLPDGVSFDAGACLGVPWLTAWQSINFRSVAAGESVLIAGGAGVVGFYAIQLAKRAGLRVITTVSSDEKASVARSAGADQVVNYRTGNLREAVARFADGGVDRIVEVDLAGNAGTYKDILRKDGLVVAYGSSTWNTQLPLSDWLVHGIGLNIFIVYELPAQARAMALASSATVLADPDFRHFIAARYPLANIVDAHEAVESGRLLGNVLVDIV